MPATAKYNIYRYKGSVSLFGDIVIKNFVAETRAVSAAKAACNFRHQALKRLKLTSGKIKLNGTILPS